MSDKDIIAVQVFFCGKLTWITPEEYKRARCDFGNIIDFKYRESNE